MPIVPENRDWTFTIRARCAECGFDGTTFAATDTPAAVRRLAEKWTAALLAHPTPSVRPNDSTWAPVEYAAHVRDVFRLYEYRLGLMLDQDSPTYPNWDQDATAVADDYLSQDPATVAEDLRSAAHSLAAAFDKVHGDQWQRDGYRSDNKHFTVETFAIYMVHDPTHHLWDITNGTWIEA